MAAAVPLKGSSMSGQVCDLTGGLGGHWSADGIIPQRTRSSWAGADPNPRPGCEPPL